MKRGILIQVTSDELSKILKFALLAIYERIKDEISQKELIELLEIAKNILDIRNECLITSEID